VTISRPALPQLQEHASQRLISLMMTLSSDGCY
jgi:hypothetical protein